MKLKEKNLYDRDFKISAMNYNKLLSSNKLCILIAIFTFISSFVYYKTNVIVTAVGGHYLFNAIDIVKIAAKHIKGGGGGKKHFAKAGGKEVKYLENAMLKTKDAILKKI